MIEASYMVYDTEHLETRSAKELVDLADAHVSISEASLNDYQDGDRNMLRWQLLRMVMTASSQSWYAMELGSHYEAEEYWKARTDISASIRKFDTLVS